MTAAAPVKTQPANAQTADDGSRFYTHPTTGERFISVTTVLSDIAKFGLPDWAASLTARAAIERIEWLKAAADHGDCHSTRTDDACGECAECVVAWLANRHNEVRDTAGDLGRKLHDAAEAETLLGPGAHVDEEVAPFLTQWKRWRDAWQPTFVAAEMTVISRKWGYGGTLDSIIQLDRPELLPPRFRHLAGLPVCVDYKTGKHLDIPKGWQVNAYSKADAVLLEDGTELPMPDIKGGLIVHIRPNKLQVREVHLTDYAFDGFIHTVRVAEGLDAGLNSVLSRPYTLKES